nr:lysophospholipid acyltransferase family protein [uncultured Carboxylicivirga sp.]
MNVIFGGLFYFFIALIGITPFFILYLFSDFTRIVLGNWIKYRQKVIQSNLKRVFPDKPDKEINKLIKLTYQNLADNLAESLKTFTLRKSAIAKRHKILNPELLDKYLQNGQSVIGVTAHYNNWEWGSVSAGVQTPYRYIAFYKPIRNKIINKAILKSRSRCGTELVSIYETSKTFEANKNKPCVYLMAADQSPSVKQLKHAYWIKFLGQRTAFLHGVEKHAKANNYPVIYINIQRIKRGYYTVELTDLSNNPSALEDGELTKRYAKKLEEIIIAKPENWLWSHKRWKHSPATK